MKFLLIIFTAITAMHCVAQQPQEGKHTNIFIVRHGEKQNGDDPLLTDDGNKRAGDLVRTLKNKGIKRIYVTEFKRTQHTADSMRIQLSIDTVQIVSDTSCLSLFNAISDHHDWNKPILIISHSNIIQKIIYKLGITDFPQENIPATEFDNLYEVKFKKSKPLLIKRKYGKPSGSFAPMMK